MFVVLAILVSAGVALYETIKRFLHPQHSPTSASWRLPAWSDVVASAACLWAGVRVADPVIGLAITLVILGVTWASWRVVSAARTTQRPPHRGPMGR
jgi:Co/Zn/Cd efflux system component